MNDFAQPFVGEINLLAHFQAVLLGLLRDQVLVRDVQLLFSRVAGQLNDFHAVPQRLRDGIHPVRGGDEQHFGKIERHIQIMIAERVVLLGVENFHQRRGRIAAEIAAELIHFVQHHDRVVGFPALQSLNNLAGQRADVGAPVAANLGFVVHAAKSDAHEFAAERTRDGLAERSFADTWRPHEAKDWPLHAGLKFLHRQVIEDALLHLLQVVVVFVQNLVRFRDIDFRAARRLAPRQGSHPFEVGA